MAVIYYLLPGPLQTGRQVYTTCFPKRALLVSLVAVCGTFLNATLKLTLPVGHLPQYWVVAAIMALGFEMALGLVMAHLVVII